MYIHNTYVCACIYRCIHTYIHHAHIYKHIHTYLHTYIHTHTHTHTYMYIQTYIHRYINTHTHTYYIHTYKQTYRNSWKVAVVEEKVTFFGSCILAFRRSQLMSLSSESKEVLLSKHSEYRRCFARKMTECMG
jgi:hypothetical protein